MRVAGSGHGEASRFCVLQGFVVVAFCGHGGVEDFERINIEGVECFGSDTRTPFVEGMGWNADAASLFDFREHFAGGFAFQVGQRGADAEEVTFRCAHFDSGYDEKTIR